MRFYFLSSIVLCPSCSQPFFIAYMRCRSRDLRADSCSFFQALCFGPLLRGQRLFLHPILNRVEFRSILETGDECITVCLVDTAHRRSLSSSLVFVVDKCRLSTRPVYRALSFIYTKIERTNRLHDTGFKEIR